MRDEIKYNNNKTKHERIIHNHQLIKFIILIVKWRYYVSAKEIDTDREGELQ